MSVTIPWTQADWGECLIRLPYLAYSYTTLHHQPSKHSDERCTVLVGVALVGRSLACGRDYWQDARMAPKAITDRHADLLDPRLPVCLFKLSQPKSAGPVAVDERDVGSVVALKLR